jgi:hypothetical protein
VTGTAAGIQPARQQYGAAGDREQLTHLLRSLAAQLDHLDRQLTDLAWRQRRWPAGPGVADTFRERTALEAERARLNGRLGVLAAQLTILDTGASDGDDINLPHADRPDADLPPADRLHARGPHQRVGMCPYCGYPSLNSGLCAFCRPHI